MHEIAEPLVDDFMGQGRFNDKGQFYHLASQKGERGHGIARGQEVFYDGKPFVRIGGEHILI